MLFHPAARAGAARPSLTRPCVSLPAEMDDDGGRRNAPGALMEAGRGAGPAGMAEPAAVEEALWTKGKRPRGERSSAQEEEQQGWRGPEQNSGLPLLSAALHDAPLKAKRNGTLWGFQRTQGKHDLKRREQRSRHEAGFPLHIQKGNILILNGL